MHECLLMINPWWIRNWWKPPMRLVTFCNDWYHLVLSALLICLLILRLHGQSCVLFEALSLYVEGWQDRSYKPKGLVVGFSQACVHQWFCWLGRGTFLFNVVQEPNGGKSGVQWAAWRPFANYYATSLQKRSSRSCLLSSFWYAGNARGLTGCGWPWWWSSIPG